MKIRRFLSEIRNSQIYALLYFFTGWYITSKMLLKQLQLHSSILLFLVKDHIYSVISQGFSLLPSLPPPPHPPPPPQKNLYQSFLRENPSDSRTTQNWFRDLWLFWRQKPLSFSRINTWLNWLAIAPLGEKVIQELVFCSLSVSVQPDAF